MVYKIIDGMKKKRKGKIGDLALKIDVSKAYDRVNWDYLEDFILRMGFAPKRVAIIMLCVKSMKYLVSVNDQVIGPILPERGLR